MCIFYTQRTQCSCCSPLLRKKKTKKQLAATCRFLHSTGATHSKTERKGMREREREEKKRERERERERRSGSNKSQVWFSVLVYKLHLGVRRYARGSAQDTIAAPPSKGKEIHAVINKPRRGQSSSFSLSLSLSVSVYHAILFSPFHSHDASFGVAAQL